MSPLLASTLEKWWLGEAVQVRDGHFKGTGNYFVNWYGTNRCNYKLTAMIDNINQKSKVPPQIFTTTTFHNVENDNLFDLAGNIEAWANNDREMCGGQMACTGPLNTLFKFVGSTTTPGLTHSAPIPVLPSGVNRPASGTFQVLANNPNVGPYIMEGSNACTYHVAWNAFICLDQFDTIGMLTFSSTKWNRFIRNVSPVNVTRKVAHGSTGTGQVFPWNLNAPSVWPNGVMNRLNQWRDKCWVGPYLCLKRLLRIASLFKARQLTAAQQLAGG